MDAAHARVTIPRVEDSSPTMPDSAAGILMARRSSESPTTKLRVLLAERRASAQSELSRRVERAGHEMLARVTSAQGALDYAALLRPDVVLVAPVLEDGPGVMAALNLTRELPGIAAVVLSTHPAAANPAARPNWGAVAILPADAESEDLDAELRRAVTHARSLASELGLQAARAASAPRPADFAPAVPPTPQYVTPAPSVPVAPPVAPAVQVRPVSSPSLRPVTPVAAAPRPVTPPAAPVVQMRPVPSQTPDANPRPALSFTDEDLLAIGPFVETGEAIKAAVKPTGTPSVAATVVAAATATPASIQPAYDSDSEVIGEAAECLLERTGLSRSDAMRLMEQEAADTGQRLIDVAHAVLGRDGADAEVQQVA